MISRLLSIALVGLMSITAFAQEKICINGVCYDVVSTVVQPQPMRVPAPAPQADAMLLRSDSMKFRKSLMQAASNARKSGEISLKQYFAIAAASRNPARLEEFKQAAHETAIEEGVATVQAVDWDKLIGFLEKLIPLIVQLIGLFG